MTVAEGIAEDSAESGQHGADCAKARKRRGDDSVGRDTAEQRTAFGMGSEISDTGRGVPVIARGVRSK